MLSNNNSIDIEKQPLIENKNQNNQVNQSVFEFVPNEVIKLIVSKIGDFKSVAHFAMTSKRMHHVTEETTLTFNVHFKKKESICSKEEKQTYSKIRQLLNIKNQKNKLDQDIITLNFKELPKLPGSTHQNLTAIHRYWFGTSLFLTIGGFFSGSITTGVLGIRNPIAISTVVTGAIGTAGLCFNFFAIRKSEKNVEKSKELQGLLNNYAKLV